MLLFIILLRSIHTEQIHKREMWAVEWRKSAAFLERRVMHKTLQDLITTGQTRLSSTCLHRKAGSTVE